MSDALRIWHVVLAGAVAGFGSVAVVAALPPALAVAVAALAGLVATVAEKESLLRVRARQYLRWAQEVGNV